jgi:hypothetical protein
MNPAPEAPPAGALAKFLRTLSSAALELANAIENGAASAQRRSLDTLQLGSLQQQVAQTLGLDTEDGMSPREITRSLDRSDEPNIRAALGRLQTLGVAELVPGLPGPQRWRLTSAYRG